MAKHAFRAGTRDDRVANAEIQLGLKKEHFYKREKITKNKANRVHLDGHL